MIGKLQSLLLDLWVKVIRPFRAINRSEDRLQVVVMLLSKRIELVVVALRALDRHRTKRVERVADHLIAVRMPSDFAIDLGLRHFGMPDPIPRSRRDEAQPQDAVRSARKKHIARKLLLDEACIRLVVVEGLDDVVAIRPCVGPELVFVVAARVGVLHHVEPVPSPALTVVLRSEQTIDQPLISRRLRARGFLLRLFHKRFDFVRRWRQANQIKVQPPNEYSRIRRLRRSQLLLGQCFDDEEVDGVFDGRLLIGNC